MKVKARQVGNSITVTIPRQIVMELGIRPEMEIDVTVSDQTIRMEPVESRWDRLLAELRKEAAERGLTENDIEQALQAAEKVTLRRRNAMGTCERRTQGA
jgi:antitoxin component of MazEF toxin-antitoxin module